MFYKIVCKVVINRLGDKIFHDYQYGFIRNRNPYSATKAIEIVKKQCQERNRNHQIIFLDNSPALEIKPVLDLLIEMSILKKYVKWLESLIRGRYEFTEVNTIKSAKFEKYSPSAQGSPLAATMYTVAHNLEQICYDNLNCNWKLVLLLT